MDKDDFYLIGEKGIRKLNSGKAEDLIEEDIPKFTKKQISLRSHGLAVTDKEGNLMKLLKKQYAQHFYPLSIVDYAKVSYNYARFGNEIPILSIDSHDTITCDFSCQDCLSGAGRNIPLKSDNYNFDLPLNFYLNILREISEYSSKRGFDHVRFEQSGEGNPDLYPHRAELIKNAKKKFGMESVYVTTGSKMNEDITNALIENGAFLRVSFPGIDPRSYELYSHQSKYQFEDSLKKLEKIVNQREKEKSNLLIGVRAALRPEHESFYFHFAQQIKDLGVDVLQIVKILVPEGQNLDSSPLSKPSKNQLEKVNELSDNEFCINLPNVLDSLYYGRVIQDRSNFPERCYSCVVQPVLAGRDLYVCTKSEVMYSHKYQLGRFNGNKEEINQFLSKENIIKTTQGAPKTCEACCSMFDNVLMHEIYQLTKKIDKNLEFYELVK